MSDRDAKGEMLMRAVMMRRDETRVLPVSKRARTEGPGRGIINGERGGGKDATDVIFRVQNSRRRGQTWLLMRWDH